MKTPARTILPDNPHERPVHEVKRGIIYRCYIYCLIIFGPFFIYEVLWEHYFKLTSGLIKKPVLEITVMAILSIGAILWVLEMVRAGDIYFYERYVEIRRFLPFMKRKIIYYDQIHVRIIKKEGLDKYWDKLRLPISRYDGRVYLDQHKTLPKFWKSPYAWLEIATSESIRFSAISNPEILEFVKTKAQSVDYRD